MLHELIDLIELMSEQIYKLNGNVDVKIHCDHKINLLKKTISEIEDSINKIKFNEKTNL